MNNRLRLSGRLVARILLLAVGIIVLALVCSPSIMHLVLKNKVATIKAQGDPVCAEDLARSIPPEQNAAHDLRKVFKVIDDEKVKNEIDAASKISSWGPGGSDPEVWAKARKVAAEYRYLLPIVKQAASKPKCDFEFDWSVDPPTDIVFREYSSVRNLQRLLSTLAIVDARDDRIGRAVEEIELGLKVSEFLQEEPTLIGQLVRVATLAIASRAMQRSLDYAVFTEEQAKRLSDALSRIDTYPGWIIALKGERAMDIDTFDYFRKSYLGGRTGEGMPTVFGQYLGVFFGLDELVLIDRMSHFIEALDHPHRSFEKIGICKRERLPRYAIMTDMMIPGITKSAAKRDAGMVTVTGDRIFLALIVYKKRYGSYPATLKELDVLGWDLRTEDLFSGKDFVYSRKGNGFMFYSIGQDLVDDGGKTIKPPPLPQGTMPMPPFPPLPPSTKGGPPGLPPGMPPLPPRGDLPKSPPPGLPPGPPPMPGGKASSDKPDESTGKYIYAVPGGRKAADIIWSRER